LTRSPLDLKAVLDVPLRVSVVLGRTRMRLEDVARLTRGAVVELDRLQGEPLDVMVGDKVVARGEAVVVNGKLGVRLLEVVGEALERAG